jgi:hypothetical protein
MAQATAQQKAPTVSQPERSTPANGPSGASENTSPSQGCEASRSDGAGRTGQANSAGQNAVDTTLPNQPRFWSITFPRIANFCGVLGLFLAVIFGATQWAGQDKSNAIAKESELVSLAISCSDEV